MFFAQSASVTTENVQREFPRIVEAITADVAAFWPELILCIGTCWVILFDLFGRRERSHLIGYHALVFVALSLAAVLSHGFDASTTLFRGMIVDDGFGAFFKAVMLVGTAICIVMVMMQQNFRHRRMGEFYGLLLGSVVGMFLMVTAKNLLMFFLGIEFASYTSYLLTAYLKGDRRASEGGLKYVVYGSVASGTMAYGLSLIYGLTGSLDIATVANELIVAKTTNFTVLVAALLTFAGFAYKIAAFPMHFWSPDVYEGAPIPFTAFLSVISKAAGFAVFIRFIQAFSGGGGDLLLPGGAVVALDWPLIIAVVAALTMTVGNLAALFQTNLKRLLAYSSIAHAGYLLMGVAALRPGTPGGPPGWHSVLFYLLVYLFMNLGAFLVVSIISNRTGKETLDGYRGLGSRNALLAVALFVFAISLIGLPPTGGFTGKFQLLKAAMDSGLTWLALVAVLNTVVSVYYYARIIKVMFLDQVEEGEGRLVLAAPVKAFLWLMMLPIFYLGIFFNTAIEFIRELDLTIS